MKRVVRRFVTLGTLFFVLSACAVAPTPKPADLSDRTSIRALQEPNQQRNVYFVNEASLFPRSREVLLSDQPLVVANALLGQLRRGPRPDIDGVGVTTEFSPTWKFRAASVDADGTVVVDVGGGADVARDNLPLCQMILTLIDGRKIKAVRLVDGVKPITTIVDANGEEIDARLPITKDPCEILDKEATGIRLLLVKDSQLIYVDRQITGIKAQAEPLEWTKAILDIMVGGPRPQERTEGFLSDVALASPEMRLDSPNAYVLTLAPEFDGLSAIRQARVLAQILDALENVPNKSFGAVLVQVGGTRKTQVPGPDGLISTPIQRTRYLSMLPIDEQSTTSTAGSVG